MGKAQLRLDFRARLQAASRFCMRSGLKALLLLSLCMLWATMAAQCCSSCCLLTCQCEGMATSPWQGII